MSELYKDLEEEELKAKRLWKSFTPTQKHMVLMFIYRLRTDLGHIKDYLETHRFFELKIGVEELPKFVCTMTIDELYREAYEVIGQNPPIQEAAE